jgi:circadian clock protein KaiC
MKKKSLNKKKIVSKKKVLKKLVHSKKISKKVKSKRKLVSNKMKKKVMRKLVSNKMKKKFVKKHVVKLTSKSKPATGNYIKLGITGFDALFENGYGIPSGTSVLVEGGPGSGKTNFCLTAMNGLCKQGKKCLYMSFEEPEENLKDHMKKFGFDVEPLIKKNLLKIKRFNALDISRSVEALLSAAKKELLIEIDPVLFPRDFAPDFVIIDSLSSIASAFSGHESRFRIYMEQLFRYLEKNKITTFLIREVATPTHIGSNYKEEGEAVSFLSDGIIIIYNVIYSDGKRGSALEILKLRGVDFKKRVVKMEILNNKGVVVHPDITLSSGKSDFNLT